MEVKIDPKEVTKIIDTEVRLAIAKALGEQPENLIKAVVDTAMSAKANSYDRKTVFQDSVDTMIREEAREVFKEWLSEKRSLIREAIGQRLKAEKDSFIDSIADQLMEGLAKSFYVSVHMKVEED